MRCFILCILYMLHYLRFADSKSPEFHENMTPAQLYEFLRSNHIPEKDCQIIKGIIILEYVVRSKFKCVATSVNVM